MRDDFSKATIERLAKRVGMRCSHPDCRTPTSGPDSAEGTINVGVAAHITSASPGGARYNSSLSSVERSSLLNGIWLCQTHAKMIDDDEVGFPESLLREWQETAIHMAAVEQRGYSITRANRFEKLEKIAPELTAEMRTDLVARPRTRQFILMERRMTYNGGRIPLFIYYFDDHQDLLGIMSIMESYGAIVNARFNSVDRYNFTEMFVEYLVGDIATLTSKQKP
ncbi:hypothetical protein [Shinella sp.]|uniref:hypothetical protein n=1 Tax=Shinella sp. TaxID=1870904 RepID=UPI003F71576B